MYVVTTGQTVNVPLTAGTNPTSVSVGFPPNKNIYTRFSVNPAGTVVYDGDDTLDLATQYYSPGHYELSIKAPATRATVTVRVSNPDNMLADDEALEED